MVRRGVPHITISTARNVSPAMSNVLLESTLGAATILPVQAGGGGTIRVSGRLGAVVVPALQGGSGRRYILKQEQWVEWSSQILSQLGE